ncbi:MAG: hypothetical protein QOC56_2133 [Alphaproteobacteria bacterium]|nr:hypothetical protein [Alphaproteobacteria bacterium]
MAARLGLLAAAVMLAAGVAAAEKAPFADADVSRVERAAKLLLAGRQDSADYKDTRDNAARELAGRLDGAGIVTASELKRADDAIARQTAILQGTLPPPKSVAEVAHLAGRPPIPGLTVIYLHPLGDPAHANAWRNIIAHQTEGPAGAARAMALQQFANPTKRGVTLWVETDGTAFWATAEHAIPTHGDGANRNDNRHIDNGKTYRIVIKTNSIGVEFVGNYPDVAKPVSGEQMRTWLVLLRFLQERYRIGSENVYAHNWIDYKDRRYCEGCELATAARQLGYVPGRSAATSNGPR